MQSDRPDVPAIQPLVFVYRNYKGEVATRRVKPICFQWGSTKWHPEPGWLLLARDVDKRADRLFAVKDIVRFGDADPAQPNGALVTGLTLDQIAKMAGE